MSEFSKKLCALYEGTGYIRYKMNRFEEYDLYAGNKDFLISDSVITFTDSYGRLMALKPDVTLSIVKNVDRSSETVNKMFYDENVFRTDRGSGQFRELRQVGLECIGGLDSYSVSEVLYLAQESLRMISGECMLDVSDLSILSKAIDSCGAGESDKKKILELIGSKNSHELAGLLKSINADPDAAGTLLELAGLCGRPGLVIPRLKELLPGDEKVAELERAVSVLDESIAEIDFSVVNNINYYNGIVFNGFVSGAPAPVLSGGRYDRLMERMGKDSGAIGFAVYLDAVESFYASDDEYDGDVLIIYDGNSSPAEIINMISEYNSRGLKAAALPGRPSKLRYRQIVKAPGGAT